MKTFITNISNNRIKKDNVIEQVKENNDQVNEI